MYNADHQRMMELDKITEEAQEERLTLKMLKSQFAELHTITHQNSRVMKTEMASVSEKVT